MAIDLGGEWLSLGYVTTTPGQPIQLTTNAVALNYITNAGGVLLCHSIMVQQVRTNAGFILVGRQGLNEGTGTALNAVLAVPSLNSLPSVIISISDAMNALNASEYYIDFTTSSDKALVSVLVL